MGCHIKSLDVATGPQWRRLRDHFIYANKYNKLGAIIFPKNTFGKTLGRLAALCSLAALLPTAAMAIECRHQPGNGSWGWRIIDGDKCWYEGRRVIAKEQLHWPKETPAGVLAGSRDRVAARDPVPKPAPPSWLERASDKTGPAEIYFPTMTPGNMLETYQPLIWQQPWLRSDSIMHWPLLLEVDRVPFTAWTKRIGQ